MVNNRPLLNIEGSCIHTNLLKHIKVIPYFIYWLVLLFLSKYNDYVIENF